MNVNKIQIKLSDVKETGYLKLPVSLDFSSISQIDVLNKDFIEVERKRAINPIIDYDKTRFIPKNLDGNIVENVKYKLNFIKNGVINNQTMYSDIGFVDNDIKFRKNNFIKSFLRLNFYDSDSPVNQNLISSVTIFSRITKDDIKTYDDGIGIPSLAHEFPLRFILNNPITKPDGFSEGFYLYHYKSDVKQNLPRELFMRASFNNAKTGKISQFMTTSTPQNINNLNNFIYTKYVLKRDSVGYFYELDNTYSSNINYSFDLDNDGILDDLTVELYEIQVL